MAAGNETGQALHKNGLRLSTEKGAVHCYYDMALARNEPAFCRKVSEPDQREYCLEQCAAIKKYEEKRVSGQLPVLPD
jgi:hypothetical protein